MAKQMQSPVSSKPPFNADKQNISLDFLEQTKDANIGLAYI